MNEWISVKARVPDDSKMVLIAGGVGFYDKEIKGWRTLVGRDSGRLIEWEVTHWMPLPNPPEAP